MAMISSFPYPPQALTTMIDALADEADEPCAASFQVAVKDYSIADEASYDLGSIQNYIYRFKLPGVLRRQ